MDLERITEKCPNNNEYNFRLFKIERLIPTEKSGQQCPKPRSGHRCVVDDDSLYSFGGFNPKIADDDEEMAGDAIWQDSKPLFRELWKFDFVSKCWTKLKTLGFTPKELASHAALLHGRTMLVYGGTGVPFGSTSSNSLHTCNLDTLVWNKVQTEGSPPEEQYGQAIALHGGALYVVGGTTGFLYSMDVHRLDLKTLHWQRLAATTRPQERYRHEIAIYGDRLFLFGGGTAIESFGFKKIACYNIKKLDWERLKTQPYRNNTRRGFPAKRRCHSLVQMNSDVYICGGYDGEVIFDDLWKFNLDTLRWTKLPTILPQPVYFHSAGISKEGCMYVYGGVTHISQNSRTSDVYCVWLALPSLKKMCWQALLQYMPNLHTVPQHKLLELGVPMNLIEKIQYYPECG